MEKYIAMKKLSIIFLLFAAVFSAGAKEKPKVSFAYDVDFEARFDNREFDKSRFTRSMTIFGARLAPQVGLAVKEDDGAEHRLMAGIDVMKDFGSGVDNIGLFRELTRYYNCKKRIARTDMEIYAGIFSRGAMEGSYSEAFFSDSLKFYDNNLEGLLFKFRRPHAYFELGCDWMGQYGATRREKFMIFTAGEGKVFPFLSLGYAGYMLHYANSKQAKGLVDNILMNPYARFEFGEGIGLQALSLRLGWLQAMQRDRVYVGDFVFPYGGEIDQHVRNWNVGVDNRMFLGYDMLPYYNGVDNAGVKYGSNLYYGDPFYRLYDDGRTGVGFYDRLEVYYEPKIARWLSARFAAVFHFNSTGYLGCQQLIGLKFKIGNRK